MPIYSIIFTMCTKPFYIDSPYLKMNYSDNSVLIAAHIKNIPVTTLSHLPN